MMKILRNSAFWLRNIILFLTIFFVGACPFRPPVDTDPPNKPILLPHSPDTSLMNEGIDAVSGGLFIEVVWLANKESDLSAYILYRYATDKVNQVLKREKDKIVATIKEFSTIDDTLSWIDSTTVLDSLFRYNYYMVAIDLADNRSDYSDTVDYMITKTIKIELLQDVLPRGFITDQVPIFKFSITSNDISIKSVILKVFDVSKGIIIWISNEFQQFGEIQFSYNYNNKALLDTLLLNHEYKWRLDTVGQYPNSGSESGWNSFTIIKE